MHAMKYRTPANTFLLQLCVCLYLLFGLNLKFSDIAMTDPPWYYYVILVPLLIVGWFMLTYPRFYIKDKLQKRGMSENKADSISLIVLISFLVIWALVFGAPD
jgi:hypothetical protein